MKQQAITLTRRWGYLYYKNNTWQYSMNADSKKKEYESLVSLINNEAPSWYDTKDLERECRVITDIIQDKLYG